MQIQGTLCCAKVQSSYRCINKKGNIGRKNNFPLKVDKQEKWQRIPVDEESARNSAKDFKATHSLLLQCILSFVDFLNFLENEFKLPYNTSLQV